MENENINIDNSKKNKKKYSNEILIIGGNNFWKTCENKFKIINEFNNIKMEMVKEYNNLNIYFAILENNLNDLGAKYLSIHTPIGLHRPIVGINYLNACIKQEKWINKFNSFIKFIDGVNKSCSRKNVNFTLDKATIYVVDRPRYMVPSKQYLEWAIKCCHGTPVCYFFFFIFT